MLPAMFETERHGRVHERLVGWLYRFLASALVAAVLYVELLRIRAGC